MDIRIGDLNGEVIFLDEKELKKANQKKGKTWYIHTSTHIYIHSQKGYVSSFDSWSNRNYYLEPDIDSKHITKVKFILLNNEKIWSRKDNMRWYIRIY